MIYAGIIIFLISFFSTMFVMPYAISYLRRMGLVVKDQNKKDKPLVPISGGLAVMGGIFLGLMSYVFIRTFVLKDSSLLLSFFAATTTILLITLIGFIDDSIVPRGNESSAGLKQWQKPLLTLVAAVPLMAINAGVSAMSFPFIGQIDFGMLYPFLLVPITLIIASNMVNLLAGMNGLEAGLGIVYMGMLGLFAVYHQNYFAAVLALSTFASLLAFLKFNWVPAKIFPGDSLTYLLGAVLACIAIMGNMEKAVMIVSIPFAIEFFLKARSGFKAKSFGYYKSSETSKFLGRQKPKGFLANGKIASHHGKKVYSLVHFFTRTEKFTEKQIVISLMIFEFLISLLIWVV